MTGPSPNEVTRALEAMREGNDDAQDRLFSLVYDELRDMARVRMARLPPGQTLQATGLVHEAFVKLLGAGAPWENRRHFFGAAARAMRNVLVEQARRKGRDKRGGGGARVSLHDVAVLPGPCETDLLALDEALQRLEEEDSRQHEVVMLRYFAGLSVDETASALDVAPATVDRWWSFARAWLLREMTRGAGEER